MRGRGVGSIAVAAIIVTSLTLSVTLWLEVKEPFPTLRYAPGLALKDLVPAEPFDEIAPGVSRFLWGYRALDITAQAFVIVVAIICCLALLKPEEAEGS